MYSLGQITARKYWLERGLCHGSGLSELNAPDSEVNPEQDLKRLLWNKGIIYGKQFKSLIETLEGKVGEVSFPKEFRDYFLDHSPTLGHLGSSFSGDPRIVRICYGNFPKEKNRSFDSVPVCVNFKGESVKYTPRDVRDQLIAFFGIKEKELFQEIVSSIASSTESVKPSLKENTMPTPIVANPMSDYKVTAAYAGAPKTRLTLSSVNARVLRIQAIKFIKAQTEEIVKAKLPAEQRTGVMKVVGEILDKDIPDAALLSIVAWMSDIAGPSILPDKFQDIAKILSSEFKEEGEALFRSNGIDLVKQIMGPVILSFFSMAEKYFTEEPVEVGPGNRIEEGLDIKKMAEDLQKEAVPVVARKSTAQKVA